MCGSHLFYLMKTSLTYRKLYLCGILAMTVFAQLNAQNKFVDRIQRKVPGKADVVIVQEQAITDLVNGAAVGNKVTTVTGTQASAETQVAEIDGVSKKRFKVKGYRIQVYAGGNSREAKRDAERIAQECKKEFPELSVYTHFFPPRWVCRVGDFRSYEEANAYIRQMRERNVFREAAVVRSMIQVSL